MIKVGIIGARGYVGEELIKVLLKHPQVKISYLAAKNIDKVEPIGVLLPHLRGRLDLNCEVLDIKKAVPKADLFFLALPHTVSFSVVPMLLANNKKVIDLSADYRIEDAKIYEEWYKVKHADKSNIKKAVYGLPELYREKIKKANLIANPGCYPTAATLGITPALISGKVDTKSIIVDAKSGVTGAGRKASVDLLFTEVNEAVKAYKTNNHQHMPEIEQELSKLAGKDTKITFCPHLIPMNRGILETIYLKLKKNSTLEELTKIYERFYKNEPFVRVVKQEAMSTKNVVNTNFCDIALRLDTERKMLVVISVIDNLLKGASGQAVQNMNIMYGFPETSGLL